MLSDFFAYFNETKKDIKPDDLYNEFIIKLGGKKFGKGVFNTFTEENLSKWHQIVTEAYPEFENKFKLFGYDWLGRCFGIDMRKTDNEGILMFEIGTNDVLEIPCSFESFLNEEIPLYSDACLAESFYYEWMEYSNTEVAYGKCVGYKVPLFLGGEDVADNLEECDMEVYWSLLTQSVV